jgi:nucleoside-diphosphate-sugar epimerase
VHRELENLIVTPSTTIQKAVEVINVNGMRGVFVCDEEKELVGIIMDSDIRKATLSNMDLEASVKTIMHTSPFVVRSATPLIQRTQEFLNSDKLLAPVVDEAGRVVDYMYIPEMLKGLSAMHSLFPEEADKPVLPPARILVVGGAGYIGSILVEKLLRMGYEVRVLDLLMYDKHTLDRFRDTRMELIRGDCRNDESIKATLEGCDAVVHLGEIVGDPACAVNESMTIETNYAATHKIVDLCMKFGIKRLVFASSCSVYGHNDEEVNEKSGTNPVSLYARCKIESENAIMTSHVEHFIPTILRLATVHGRSYRQRFDLVVNLLSIKAAVEGRIQIFGGQQWRPFISVKDVCQGIISVLHAESEKVRGQVFNLGDSRENYQLIQVGDIIKKLAPEVEVETLTENVDKRNYRVSFEKIKSTLGFTCESNVEDSVRDIISASRDEGLFSDYKDPKYHNILSLK